MSSERPKPRARGQLKAALKEFIRLLDQVQPDRAATRLQLDMARDSGLEVCRKMLQRINYLEQKVAHVRRRQRGTKTRLIQLLEALSSSPIRLPRPKNLAAPDLAHLEAEYRRLRSEDFPALTQTLHAAAGESDPLAYQLFLVEEMLEKSAPILVEHLVRDAHKPHPLEDANQFLAALHHHLIGSINQKLARKTSYRTNPEVGQLIASVLDRCLRFLLDLLTTDPPARLVFPALGSDFDPNRHEPLPGRPSSGNLLIRATLFPGLEVLNGPVRIVAPALVYTKKMSVESRSPAESGD